MNQSSSSQSIANDIKQFIDNLKPEVSKSVDDDPVDITNEWQRSKSLCNSYEEEWDRLFSKVIDLNEIKQLGISGDLRNCRFRSICWRIYLEILGLDSSKWIDEIKINRLVYEGLRNKYIIDPRKVQEESEANDDPLSVKMGSRWNEYFKSQEIMKEINQDVVRTFPEVEFFHLKDVRQSMINILYCYSQESGLSYKQGWHEILAPLIFILHCDMVAYQHSSELFETNNSKVDFYQFSEKSLLLDKTAESPALTMMKLAGTVLDQSCLEHDAYLMFECIMQVVKPWYDINNELTTPPNKLKNINSDYSLKSLNSGNISRKASLVDIKPFEKRKENLPDCQLAKKVNYIHEEILKHHDLELYMQLEQLEISPQMFGFRWLKLIFGREFTLQDLLLVWDVIFAINCDDSSKDFGLTDQLYVAMLIHIRDCLLLPKPVDFATCLTTLMRYPKDADVSRIISMALYLYQPDIYNKPSNECSLYRGVNFTTNNINHSLNTQNRLSGGSYNSTLPNRSQSTIQNRKKQRSDRNKTIVGIENLGQKFTNLIGKSRPSPNETGYFTRPTQILGSTSTEEGLSRRLPSVSDSAPVTPTTSNSRSPSTQVNPGLPRDYLEISLPDCQSINDEEYNSRNKINACLELLNQSLELLTSHQSKLPQQLQHNNTHECPYEWCELSQSIIYITHTRDLLLSSRKDLSRKTVAQQLNQRQSPVGALTPSSSSNTITSSFTGGGGVFLNRSVSSNDIKQLLQQETDISTRNASTLRYKNSYSGGNYDNSRRISEANNRSDSTSTLRKRNELSSGDISEKLKQLFPRSYSGIIKPVELKNFKKSELK